MRMQQGLGYCCTGAAKVLLHRCGKGAAAPVQQGCCCTGTPGRTLPVAAWEGGLLYGGFRSSLQPGFGPLAFECCVSAWGSTSLEASYGGLWLPGCHGG